MTKESEILSVLAKTLDPAAVKEAFSIDDEALKHIIQKAAVIFKGLEEEPDPEAPYIIYVGGVARGNPGPGGAGVVIKRSGKMVEGVAQFLGDVTKDQAECNALIIGLMRLIELDAEKVEIRSASELVVKQVIGEDNVKNDELNPLWQRVKELAENFGSLKAKHIPEQQNKDAEYMANRAIDEFENEE